MEAVTPVLSTVALWIVFGGVSLFGLSLGVVGLVSMFNVYANSDSWRRVAMDLEKECKCLHNQLESLEKRKT
jgi:hypothetical protein